MNLNEDTLFEGILVKRGDDDEPVIGEVLIYEQNGQIAIQAPRGTMLFRDDGSWQL